VLLLNILADLPMLTIVSDRVANEDIETPRRWDVRRIVELSVYLGIINAVGAFALLRVVRGQPEAAIQAAWFLYLGTTALLVLFVVRTREGIWRAPMPSWPLLSALGVAMLITLAIPTLPPGQDLFHFASITALDWLAVGICAAGYVIVAELAKRAYVRAGGHG
jgi:magnesium-transporting ATPase (P-type)